jgi:hypothetical protein
MGPAPSGAAAPAAASLIPSIADDAADQREAFAGMATRLVDIRKDVESVEYFVPAGSAAGRVLRRVQHQLAELATVAALRSAP